MRKMSLFLLLVFISCLPLFAQQSSEIATEKEAITNCALDYGVGFYSGDAERMERALHPELNKVVVVKLKPEGNYLLQYSTVSGLVEMSRGKVGLVEESKRKASVSVYEVEGNTASAKLNSSQFNDYLQLVKVDGKWKIINVLWNFGPDSRQKPVISGFNPEAEKDAVNKCALEFTQGVLEGDYTKFGKYAHAELNFVQISTIASTGKPYINKMGPSFLTELIKGKITAVPENQRAVDVKIMDSMDGYAFVKCSAPAMSFYLQIAKMGEQWNVINVLVNRKPAPKK